MPNEKKTVRGRRRKGVMGFVRPALLFMLSRDDAHGYSLLDGLSEFGFDPDRVDPSLIYRILREMEEAGWVKSYLGEESLGPQRRIYQILPDGQAHLVEMINNLRRRKDEIDRLLRAYEQGIDNKDKKA